MKSLLPYRLMGSACVMSSLTMAQIAFAASEKLECPQQIPASAIQISDSGGWTARAPKALPLSSAGFNDGSPAAQRALKPFATKNNAGQTQHTWKFEGEYPEGKWLSCSYVGGVAILSKKIGDNISECSISYRLSKGKSDSLIAIKCSD